MTVGQTKHPIILRKGEGIPAVGLAFILGCAGALAIFLPFLIVDQGFFIYAGDYNEQQIPFYYYVNGFIKQGGGTWSWATDLGSSIVTGYSFYNLGSPFLWLSLIFPQSWMPFMMVPLFCIKFGCIAAAACLYLKRYSKSRNIPVICGVMYAFCGFNIYNIFFNHMLEPVIIFPLMLWALDGFVYEQKRGFFALFVGLALLNNYFFFIGNVVFILAYFIIKLAVGEYNLSVRRFGALVFEVLLGIGIGMVLALPSVITLLGNPRVDNFSNGMGLLLHGHVQQYFNILSSLFLPPDPPYMPNLFPEGAIKWTSMSAFIPIAGMGGVFAYCRSRRGGSVKKLLLFSLVMALVPIFNSAFYAFNSSYYARWFYMPVLIMAFATMRSLEDEDIDLAGGARVALIITAAFAIFGLAPRKTDTGWALGVAGDAKKFWLTFATALLSVLLFYVLVRFFRKKLRFAPILLAAVMGFSVFYSVIHIALGKFPQWERDAPYREMQYEGARNMQLPEGEFYRVDTFNAHDNIGLWINRSSIRTFNSTVSPSIMEFNPFVGVTRDVSSKPDTKLYALRGLLSVRYTIVPKNEVEAFLGAEGVMGWRYLHDDGPYSIFENENFIPLGFTYNEYALLHELEGVNVDDRAALLMRGIGLTEEQAEKYGHYFSGKPLEWHAGLNSGDAGWYSYDYIDFYSYEDECYERRAESSYKTSYDNSGFTCNIVLSKGNLVFFGVPYDEGFIATVNGVPTEVLKVSAGMMAVEAPAGDNEIVFTYKTPGLNTGAVVSVLSLLVLAVYVFGQRWLEMRRERNRK